jgi:NADH-quinone oxidoreductase subunit B
MDVGEPIPALDRPRPGGAGYRTTRVDALLRWSRRSSLVPWAFVSSCCSADMASAWGPRFDVGRAGVSLPAASPEHADLLLVVGAISHRMAPQLERVYHLMPAPKWVVAVGACACSGGPYDTYATVRGADRVIPVDVYIPGCPPRPDALLDGIARLQERISAERAGGRPRSEERDRSTGA